MKPTGDWKIMRNSLHSSYMMLNCAFWACFCVFLTEKSIENLHDARCIVHEEAGQLKFLLPTCTSNTYGQLIPLPTSCHVFPDKRKIKQYMYLQNYFPWHDNKLCAKMYMYTHYIHNVSWHRYMYKLVQVQVGMSTLFTVWLKGQYRHDQSILSTGHGISVPA